MLDTVIVADHSDIVTSMESTKNFDSLIDEARRQVNLHMLPYWLQ